jgi:hypothetical protein
MALWQYKFYLLTKASFDSIGADPLHIKDEDGLVDDSLYWEFKAIHRSFFEGINTFLDKGQSWANWIDLYGDQESNCVEIGFKEQGTVFFASFRIDFRTDYEWVLSSLIEFCILKNLVILDEEQNLVPLNYETVKSIIEKAPQVRKYNFLAQASQRNEP